MWEKIKSFFENKVTKTVAFVFFFLSIGALALGGVTQEEIKSSVVLVFVVFAGISGLVIFINSLIKK